MNRADKLFYAYLKDITPEIVFEFGSYDLEHGLYYRNLWPQAELYCFEPDPDAYEMIKNVAEENNINLYNYAIGDVNEEKIFYPTKFLDGTIGPAGSLYKHSAYHKSRQKDVLCFADPIEVKVITIISFCTDHGINTIDFMHVDVEGASLAVVRGFGKMRPKMLRMETKGRDTLFEGAPNGEIINKLLDKIGYSIKLELEADIFYENRNNRS